MEFILSAKEQEAATLFTLSHKKHGQIKYSFIPTNLGNRRFEITCLGCLETKVITETLTL